MKRFTRAVDPSQVRDLLERVPRAYIAVNDAGTLAAVPVAFRFQDGCYWVGVRSGPLGAKIQPQQEVALIIDEGCHYFDLRAIYIRGRVRPADRLPNGASFDLTWLEVVPDKVIAWDLATMHEERSDAAH